jgi:hypothetical protein
MASKLKQISCSRPWNCHELLDVPNVQNTNTPCTKPPCGVFQHDRDGNNAPQRDFPFQNQAKSRREIAGGALVSAFDYVKGMARRVEAQYRSDWAFVPAIRNLYTRFTSLRAPLLHMNLAADPEQSQQQFAGDLLGGTEDLYLQKLWGGTYGDPQKPLRIAGDFTKLHLAHGLSPTQKRLIKNVHFLSAGIPGTQQIRKKMGHGLFGARIGYGEGLFITISPNDRHSGLCLRLSRVRRTDPAARLQD